MGRKKKNEEEGSWLLLLVFAILLLAPIALLVARIYFGKKLKEVGIRVANGEHCLELSHDEAIELRYKRSELQRVQRLLRAAMQRGADANLSVNKDGNFSARSHLGKSIRAVLEKHEPLKGALMADIRQLEALPHERQKDFRFNMR